jgi:hypothetical protein
MRTRLGSHVEGAGAIGHDVAAAEEGATQETPADDRPGYEPEHSVADPSVATAPATTTAPTAFERDPGLAAEPVVDQGSYGQEPGHVGDEPVIDRGPDERPADPSLGVAAAGAGTAGGVTGVSAAGPGVAAAGGRVDDAGPADSSLFADEPTTPESDRSVFATEDAGTADRSAYEQSPGAAGAAGYEGEPGGAGMAGSDQEPGQDVPATYTGEEADVSGRPEYAERTEGGEQPLYQDETQRMDRPGGGGSLFTDEEPERLDRPGPQEPGVQEGVYNQEADQTRRPSDGA